MQFYSSSARLLESLRISATTKLICNVSPMCVILITFNRLITLGYLTFKVKVVPTEYFDHISDHLWMNLIISVQVIPVLQPDVSFLLILLICHHYNYNRSLYSRGRINVVVLNSLFMTLNISGSRVGAVRCIKIPLFYENKLQNGLNILIKKFNSYQKSKMVPDKNMFVP